ncbi:hypothetical protein DUNSADRAFT_10814 [Dunaliella salina]|uniref:Uncharacterized protein n=1 Tax=Dunaliella salina TaxID=3046 RepID=A0ABQ7H9V8_DUNSA|nr:hypothetical protein DUNSADRAFT_10814 [Dunaliella salina]|eukprot:KAF5843639.1 hypothetical protein DUNSADRAFT_10814 [Dunaliella salina]
MQINYSHECTGILQHFLRIEKEYKSQCRPGACLPETPATILTIHVTDRTSAVAFTCIYTALKTQDFR